MTSSRIRHARTKSKSSLKGLFDAGESKSGSEEFSMSSDISYSSSDYSSSTNLSPSNSLTHQDRAMLLTMSRGLRRAKRRLLLAAASSSEATAPTADPVDQLRQLFRQVSVECMLLDNNTMEESAGGADIPTLTRQVSQGDSLQ